MGDFVWGTAYESGHAASDMRLGDRSFTPLEERTPWPPRARWFRGWGGAGSDLENAHFHQVQSDVVLVLGVATDVVRHGLGGCQ